MTKQLSLSLVKYRGLDILYKYNDTAICTTLVEKINSEQVPITRSLNRVVITLIEMLSFVLSAIVLACCFVDGYPDGREGPDYPFKYYNRHQWNAVPATKQRPLNTPVPYVVIHHTYIPGACNTTKQCQDSMRSMQSYHNSLNWGDIGYNFCVGSEGGAYEGRGWSNVGIHAGPANSVSIGICLIGDWRTELPPSVQLETTKALISTGVERGYIKSDYKLVGHRQVMATECPGGALYEHISTWDHFVPVYEEVKTAKI